MEEILVTINKEGFIIKDDNDFKNCLKWLKAKYEYITQYPKDWEEKY